MCHSILFILQTEEEAIKVIYFYVLIKLPQMLEHEIMLFNVITLKYVMSVPFLMLSSTLRNTLPD